MRRAGTALLVSALLCGASVADAQTRGRAQPPRRPAAKGPRIVVVLDGGVASPSATLTQAFSVPINAEQAPIAASLTPGVGGFVDGGVRVHLNPQLTVGAVVFLTGSQVSGQVTGQIPHPFYFGQAREVSGTTPQAPRRETGVHIELAYPVARLSSFDLRVFGGPSIIRVEQTLVTGLDYADAYPYDTATFVATRTTVARGSAVGFHVGADATRRLGRTQALAATIRYARAQPRLSAAAGNMADVTAGGLQAGVGLRLSF